MSEDTVTYYGIVDSFRCIGDKVSLDLCLKDTNGKDVYCKYTISTLNENFVIFAQDMLLFMKSGEICLDFLPLTRIGAEIFKNSDENIVTKVWLDTEMYSAQI